MKKIRVFEAFSGIGAQHEGWRRLEADYPSQVSFEFVGMSEIDKYAIASYVAAHGDVKNYGSITDIDWDNVPDFDCLTYSFPCTDISNAGKQAGFTEGSDTRSSLLWECRRAIEHKKPKWLLMENVKALTQKKFMPEFQRWIDWLTEQGYASYWQVLNSKNYGVPQNRERVFMISIKRTDSDPNPTYNFPKPFPLEKRLKDVLETNVPEEYYLKQEQVDKIIEHCQRKQAEGCGFKTNFK